MVEQYGEIANSPFFPFLHQSQLANAVTGFATCLAGLVPLILCWLTRWHPPRWMAVYLCVLITGIPTVGLHSFETNRVWGAWDVGTNILLAYVLQIAVVYDFRSPQFRRVFIPVMTVLNLAAWGYLYLYATGQVDRWTPVNFGAIEFTLPELALIANSFVAVFFFLRHWREIAPHARPILAVVIIMMLIGMFLAAPKNSALTGRILSWHAIWHIWGAFALTTLWVFNFVRFWVPPFGAMAPAAVPQPETAHATTLESKHARA